MTCDSSEPARHRQRITIETAADVPAANGTIARTWSASGSRWSSVAPAGAMPDAHNKIAGHTTYKITLPSDSATRSLSPRLHRLIFGDRVLEIIRADIDYAARKVTAFVNDFTAVIIADGLTHSAISYDCILHTDSIAEDHSAYGLADSHSFPALVRISDFSPGVTAIQTTVVLRARTFRITDVQIPPAGDWYRLKLAQENGPA